MLIEALSVWVDKVINEYKYQNSRVKGNIVEQLNFDQISYFLAHKDDEIILFLVASK